MSLVPRSHLSASLYASLFPQDVRIVIFDVETTGLSSKTDEIIELGAVELEGSDFGRTFRELAKPICRIQPAATAVHGYTAAKLKGEQSSLDLVHNFMTWLGGSELVLAGHNSSFDIDFLRTAVGVLNRVKGTAWEVPTKSLCTMRLIIDAFDGRVLDLDQACRLFGIKRRRRGLHGALEDAQLTGRLLLSLMQWPHYADSEALPLKRYKRADKQGGRVLPWVSNKC
jgi:DNA polymerase III epsilon subunit family exonuclease